MSISQSLEKLVDVLENKGISLRPYLQSGLSRADVQAALNPLSLTPPEDLYELYEWSNGVDILNTPELLFGEYQFLPLSDAVQEYEELIKHYSQVTSSISLAQCFPFASFQGSNCTIYCEPKPIEGLQHPVIEIYHGVGILFESIDRMAQTVAEWFSLGIYDTQPVDDVLRAAIRQRLNPRIPYRSVTL